VEFPAALLPYREALHAIAKPAATFEALPASTVIDPKASKMGGIPFTPIYTDWPSSIIHEGHVSRKQPQAFIGQFNLKEIVTAVPELQGVVPSQGLFQLFYDMEEPRWGQYPQDFNFITTLWYPDVDELTHRPMEQGTDSYPEREYGLKFSYRPSFPGFPYLPEEIEIPEEFGDAYSDALAYNQHHQVAGYPLPVQDDPLEELEEGDDAPWQLLFQIDSDEKMKTMWCDTGTLYLAVRTHDLVSADLSQARLIMQSC
jgi:uncharacterized protein YwqG